MSCNGVSILKEFFMFFNVEMICYLDERHSVPLTDMDIGPFYTALQKTSDISHLAKMRLGKTTKNALF